MAHAPVPETPGAPADAPSLKSFLERGWVRFPWSAETAAWAAAAAPLAEAMMAAPDAEYRCGGTWFPGVNALPNDARGAVSASPPSRGAVPPFAGPALRFIDVHRLAPPDCPLDRAQVSACLPGYPQHGAEETEAAFGYRARRDAAHVDGLLRIGVSRRRALGERHAYILGAPLTEAPPDASPFVVWEGSHELMRAAFRRAFQGLPPERWGEVDVTEIYQEARRRAFETCKRVEVPAQPGEATLTHRLALHGVAPWRARRSEPRSEPRSDPRSAPLSTPWSTFGRATGGDGPIRIIAYFRPDPAAAGAVDWPADAWLSKP